jgi:L-asparaginase II
MSDPVAVEVVRGPAVESAHRVHAVVADGDGAVKAVYGDAARAVFPRSSIKPLQAVALVESGAAEAFRVSDEELALACASHAGEERHVKGVAAWLSRLGLSEKDLECGAHAPVADPCAPASALANNCSGKHAGMLTLGLFLKSPTAGYVKLDHPVQQKILRTMSEMCGVPLPPSACCIDGCSAPNPSMPLQALARGFARFMRGEPPACRRLYQAMTQNPGLVGGEGRADTLLMRAARGKIMSKGGAEGVHVAVIPDQDTVIALKAEDGAGRASQAALYLLLEKLRLADSAVLEALKPVALPVMRNWRETEVGAVRGRA